MLRDRDGENLREHLIRTAARLLGERGSAGLAVRDIAREAQVADGALYNYFEDKEDLLAQALLAHVATVMSDAPRLMPGPARPRWRRTWRYSSTGAWSRSTGWHPRSLG